MSQRANQRSSCKGCSASALDRRNFLRGSAASATTVLMVELFGDRVSPAAAQLSAQVTGYPRQMIAKLSELAENEPLEFEYPEDAAHNTALLFRLVDSDGKARVAGGGIGEDQNIVAFSALCTHMGGDMLDGFIRKHSLLGCGEHLTTFDLTRHGMVVAGHATTALPQVLLELEGDTIFAVGVSGMLYGYSSQ